MKNKDQLFLIQCPENFNNLLGNKESIKKLKIV